MGKNNEVENMQRLFNKLDEQDRISREIPLTLNPFDFYDRKLTIANNNIIREFLMAKKLEGCTFETLDGYRVTITYFLKSINKDITKITTQDVRNFMMDYQTTRDCKNITMDTMRRIYSSFFNWLEDENKIIKSPVRKIHHIKYEKIVKKPFTEEEIERLRDACPSIRELAIIDFLNSSGVRVSEFCRLDIDDIDFRVNEAVVFGKGMKERIVYFDAKTKLHLRDYLRTRNDCEDALFISQNKPYKRLTRGGVEFILKTIGEIAEVENCHPHRFRRTLATRLIDRGVPIEQVQQLLGHTKIDTTLIYAQVNQNNVKLSHAKFCS